jgi:methylisocitrate lyase
MDKGLSGNPPNKSLRKLIGEQDLIIAPGVWDGVSAAIAEQVGFDAILTPGWGVAAALGYPDADIYTRTQNAAAVRTIANTTTAAVLADIDGGYGNPISVYYTMREFESAGAGGVLLEDQRSPKRCNWLVEELDLEDVEVACAKIRAAADARQDKDIMIVARTDAEGDEIYRRGVAYVEAGADMICPICVQQDFGPDSWRRLADETGVPLMSAFVPGTWQEREFTPDVCKEIGVKLVTLGLQHFYAATAAIRSTMQAIKDGAPVTEVFEDSMSHDDFCDIIGIPEVFELERRYLGDDAKTQIPTASVIAD